jgi:hypothetical protein
MAVMQYKKAEKILSDALKYLPNLRNFLLQRIECFIAMNKISDAKKEISALKDKVLSAKEDSQKEKDESKKLLGILDQLELSI